MKKFLFLFFAALFFPLMARAETIKPHILATIKPIASIVANLGEGWADVDVLLDKASPHGYSLKPSDIKAMEDADLIIAVAPQLESFLGKVFEDPQTFIIAEKIKGVLHTCRESGLWAAHHHEEENGHHRHYHEKKCYDAHLWLDPIFMIKFAEILAADMSIIWPDQQNKILRNLVVLQEKLAALDQDLRAQLVPYQKRPFLVFHDAYQYFEKRYGLNGVGSLTIAPNVPLGPKRIQEIRARIAGQNVKCLLTEPQFSTERLKNITQDLPVKWGAIDPLGMEIAFGKDFYEQLLKNMADSLQNCLNTGDSE